MDPKETGGSTDPRHDREERMRYEVLEMLARAADGDPERPVHCGAFAEDIGAWREEVFRVIDFLDRAGLVRYCGAGPILCITDRGLTHLRRASDRRIPDEA